jgi:hypothetical protein
MYGAKKWLLFPPHNMIMSNQPIMKFYKEDMPKLTLKGVKVTTCMQTAGDVIIIPECWGHGVLNVQTSVAVAFEMINYVWRFKSSPGILQSLPANKRAMVDLG